MAESFYIEPLEDIIITVKKYGSPTIGQLEYSLNDVTFVQFQIDEQITATARQKVYFRFEATTDAFDNRQYIYFTTTGQFNIGGNIQSLIYEEGLSSIPRDGCFYYLFKNCTGLIDASKLQLVTDFANHKSVYNRLFCRCESLIAGPPLLAKQLASDCYQGMFQYCLSLTEPPIMEDAILATGCYSSMFYGCSSLLYVPELPSLNAPFNCYGSMFYDCASLKYPPNLPATTLGWQCYQSMFDGCTNLLTLPDLPATQLSMNCYFMMFERCSNIKVSAIQTPEYCVPYRIPSGSNIGTDAEDATKWMFYGTGGTFLSHPEINTTYYLSTNFYTGTLNDNDNNNIYPYIRKDGIIDKLYEVPDGGITGQVLTRTLDSYQWADAPDGLRVIDKEEIPERGMLISMDLGNINCIDRGLGLNCYRILKVNGNQALCLAMYDYKNTSYGSTNNYNNSNLDTELNINFYESLNAIAKQAIIPTNISQYRYFMQASTESHASRANYPSKLFDQDLLRNVFTLDEEDIEEYFGGTGGTVDDHTPGQFSKTDIQELFWNSILDTSTIDTFIWLRSAAGLLNGDAFYVNKSDYEIGYDETTYNLAARPAFYIDLSQIEWSRYTPS